MSIKKVDSKEIKDKKKNIDLDNLIIIHMQLSIDQARTLLNQYEDYMFSGRLVPYRDASKENGLHMKMDGLRQDLENVAALTEIVKDAQKYKKVTVMVEK